MKLLIVYLLFLFQRLYGFDYEDDENLIDGSYRNDFEAGGEITEIIYDIIEHLIYDSGGSALGMALRTTNVDCIEREYERYDLTYLLPDMTDWIGKSSFDEVVIFASVATMCSSERNQTFWFKFDQMISESGPTMIIRQDPSFRLFAENFDCFHNYAINQGLLKARDNESLNVKTDGDCLAVVERFREVFSLKSNHSHLKERSTCLREIYSFDESTLKFLVLMKLNLREKELLVERESYIEASCENHEKMVLCAKSKI